MRTANSRHPKVSHPHAILWTLAALVGTGGLGACAGEGDELDAEVLALEESDDADQGDAEPGDLADGALAEHELDALLVDGITVEDGIRLRDVIHLLPPDALPGLTEADLDTLVIADPQTNVHAPDVEDDPTAAFDGADALAADIDPLAIGETACSSASITNATHGAQVAMTPEPAYCGVVWDGTTSPNTAYNPAGCPNQYITQVTGTTGRELDFYWKWRGPWLDADTCPLAHVFVTAYGRYYLPSWNGSHIIINVVWTKLATEGRYGKWYPGGEPLLLSSCEFQLDQGSATLPHLGPNHIYNRLRIASQGIVFALWPLKQRMEAGVTFGDHCVPG